LRFGGSGFNENGFDENAVTPAKEKVSVTVTEA
jgi:hypothetical protein